MTASVGCPGPGASALALALCSTVVLALAATGCDEAHQDDGGGCTELGCLDGLRVALTTAMPWPHGEYRISVDQGETTTTCTGSLPLPPCENGTGFECQGPGAVVLSLSGCALDPSEHAIGDLLLVDHPQSVEIRVELDGTTIATGAWEPTYQTQQPNGPDCEPTCLTAVENLPVAFD